MSMTDIVDHLNFHPNYKKVGSQYSGSFISTILGINNINREASASIDRERSDGKFWRKAIATGG
jgi:hypothetical protein